jgi:hypothetical protein
MDQQFAAAAWGEQDAGSGPVHASPSFGPVATAVHNISARHMHDIGTAVPDDRQFLRAWRRQLQDCMAQQNSRVVQFLLADGSGSFAATEVAKRSADVLAKYSKSTWSFTSSTRDLALSTDVSAAAAAIENEVGCAPDALREYSRRTVRSYVATAAALCAAETRLEEKLKRLETVAGRVGDLIFLEPTPELEALGQPMRNYLNSVLEKIDIEAEYRELTELYKKFSLLKNLVSMAGFQRAAAAPTCTICMTKEVAQVVAPCGHTFCEDCCKTQMTACYICRVQIRDKMRLFFN